MTEITWPVIKCENCGFDLREAAPKRVEQGVDITGKLIWTDFCPRCGRGYQVGDRELIKVRPMGSSPVEKVLEEIPFKPKPDDFIEVPKPSETVKVAVVAEVSESAPEVTEVPVAEAIKDFSTYFCTECNSIHRYSSKSGQDHLKYKKEN